VKGLALISTSAKVEALKNVDLPELGLPK